MPTPSVRNPIRPARGDYADLSANVLDLYDGELCYAVDQDILYVVESGVLTPVNSIATGDTFSTNISGAAAGESLNYDGSTWTNGGPQDGGNF